MTDLFAVVYMVCALVAGCDLRFDDLAFTTRAACEARAGQIREVHALELERRVGFKWRHVTGVRGHECEVLGPVETPPQPPPRRDVAYRAWRG